MGAEFAWEDREASTAPFRRPPDLLYSVFRARQISPNFEYPSTPEASAPELRRFLVKKNSLDKSVGIALAAVLSCGTVFMAPAALAHGAQRAVARHVG